MYQQCREKQGSPAFSASLSYRMYVYWGQLEYGNDAISTAGGIPGTESLKFAGEVVPGGDLGYILICTGW